MGSPNGIPQIYEHACKSNVTNSEEDRRIESHQAENGKADSVQLKAAKVSTRLWYTWCGVVNLQYINLLGEIVDEATFGCP